jgi:hypothetical protein
MPSAGALWRMKPERSISAELPDFGITISPSILGGSEVSPDTSLHAGKGT